MLYQVEDVDQQNKNADEISEDVTQKSSGCITLSQIPRAHWVSLFQLEAIKLRSKPLAPPNKKPVRAPFFLPSVVAQGSATPSFPTSQEYQKLLKQKGQPEGKDETAAKDTEHDQNEEPEELPSVWEDKGAEEIGWTIDTSRDDSMLLNIQENVDDNEGWNNSVGAFEAQVALPDEKAVAQAEHVPSTSHRHSQSKIFNKKTKLPR
jgi:hypothetical protein